MLLDLANPVADELFVIPSSSYPVQGDCTAQPIVYFTDGKALQRISCVSYQINRHVTRNQLQSGNAQALICQSRLRSYKPHVDPRWLCDHSIQGGRDSCTTRVTETVPIDVGNFLPFRRERPGHGYAWRQTFFP